MFRTLLLLLCCCNSAFAATATIAVATNFTQPMRDLVQQFHVHYPQHRINTAFGSSGKLFAQIHHGAPFDAFLSADQDKPTRLANAKLALKDSQFSYAEGRIALWSSKPDFDLANTNTPQHRFHTLAAANAKLAPYGQAAKAAMKAISITTDRLVTGENIGQTFQFVATQNVDAGFVALSQLKQYQHPSAHNYWLVPKTLHQAILQDAILLQRGNSNVAATEFLMFLQTAAAQQVLRDYGYHVPTRN